MGVVWLKVAVCWGSRVPESSSGQAQYGVAERIFTNFVDENCECYRIGLGDAWVIIRLSSVYHPLRVWRWYGWMMVGIWFVDYY